MNAVLVCWFNLVWLVGIVGWFHRLCFGGVQLVTRAYEEGSMLPIGGK